jgi:diacylglycerol kinase (ATP)
VARRFLIVHNPDAGKPSRRLLHDVIARLRAAGATVELREPNCLISAGKIAAEAARAGAYTAIVAAGGDGTIRCVASALRDTGTPLGLIPLGTGNVMAQELGLKARADAVADCLLSGQTRTAHGALVNGVPFFLMCGVGIDAEAVTNLDLALKRRICKLAYVLPVALAVLRRQPALRIEIDDVAHTASWAVVCSACHYAGSFVLARDASLFAPGIIVMICTARSRLGLIASILAIGVGRPEAIPWLSLRKARKVRITAKQALAVQVDGEAAGTVPVDIIADPQSLQVLAPMAAPSVLAHKDKAAA